LSREQIRQAQGNALQTSFLTGTEKNSLSKTGGTGV
jgi:adenosine deaminase